MRTRAFLLAPMAASLLVFPLLTCPPRAVAQAEGVSAEERAAFHRDPEWLSIAAHLPNPKTATPKDLEMAADVLQARRFPEDALDYYGYALARGGPVSELLNKMGVVRLGLHQIELAHALFQQTVRAKKKDPVGWNNLGVTEYMEKNYNRAISDYQRASKLNKGSAAYHVNLGMAYFEDAKMDQARKEFAVAVAIDPEVLTQRGSGGTTMQIVGTQNAGKLNFEMAKVYARQHDETAMMLWLSKATEAGFDTENEMPKDPVLAPFVKDPRVIQMLENEKELKARAVAGGAPAPSLGAATGQVQ